MRKTKKLNIASAIVIFMRMGSTNRNSQRLGDKRSNYHRAFVATILYLES